LYGTQAHGAKVTQDWLGNVAQIYNVRTQKLIGCKNFKPALGFHSAILEEFNKLCPKSQDIALRSSGRIN